MKWTAAVLAVLLVLAIIPLPGAMATVTPISVLAELEVMLYGETRDGSLMERVETMEEDIFGETKSGAVMLRIDRMKEYLQSSGSDAASLMLQLNMAEWGFVAYIDADRPLLERLDELEMTLLGETQAGPIQDRTENLMVMVWGTARLDSESVVLPSETLVKIRMLNHVDSGKNEVGDKVRFRVVEDVKINGRIVIPAGLEAEGEVTEVTSAGRLGRDGRLVIDFGQLTTLDGLKVPVKIDERATEENRSLELAAGASMAGVLLLGPIGLVSGYFIRGQDVKIPAATEFYVETGRQVRTTGLRLQPATQ